MNAVKTPTRRRHRVASSTLALLVAFAAYALPAAQPAAKKALTVEDYTKWRSISSQEISGDGKWVAYTLQLTNTVAAEAKPVLHLKNLETNEEIKVEHATGGIFSPDSKWIAYQVDPGAAQRARQGRSGQGGSGSNQTPDANPATPTAPALDQHPRRHQRSPPLPRSHQRKRRRLLDRFGAGLRPGAGERRDPAAPRRTPQPRDRRRAILAGHPVVHLLADLHPPVPQAPARRSGGAAADEAVRGGPGGGGAPVAGGGRGGAAETPAGPRGIDVILLDLRTGRHQLLGSVGDIAFNRTGTLLAYTVDAAVKDGNGLFVFDTRSGRIDAARQRREAATTGSRGTTTARRSPSSRAATSRRCARRTTCWSPSRTCRPRSTTRATRSRSR